jgi:hypothetical protein
MQRSIMMHVDPADRLHIVKPQRASDTGSLELLDAHSLIDHLVILPPTRPADAIDFLDALAEKANELREAIAARCPELTRTAA